MQYSNNENDWFGTKKLILGLDSSTEHNNSFSVQKTQPYTTDWLVGLNDTYAEFTGHMISQKNYCLATMAEWVEHWGSVKLWLATMAAARSMLSDVLLQQFGTASQRNISRDSPLYLDVFSLRYLETFFLACYLFLQRCGALGTL